MDRLHVISRYMFGLPGPTWWLYVHVLTNYKNALHSDLTRIKLGNNKSLFKSRHVAAFRK